MKVMVVSDTHGARVLEICNIARADKEITHILHLGDYASDAEQFAKLLPDKKVLGVRGNNDIFSRFPLERQCELCGKKMLLIHGHTYGVKTGLHKLAHRARELDAELVLFGHTHLKCDEAIDGIRFLNPSARGYILINDDGSWCSYAFSD